MEANYTIISETHSKPISIEWNNIQVKIQKFQKPIGKYKKVGAQIKNKLIQLVSQGHSIIKVSSSLKINYSTAKSILQNLKKKQDGKESTSPSVQNSINQSQNYQMV